MSLDKCWLCEKKLENGQYNGHFHCDRCGASMTDGEDAWYWVGEEKICNECKVKDSQGN